MPTQWSSRFIRIPWSTASNTAERSSSTRTVQKTTSEFILISFQMFKSFWTMMHSKATVKFLKEWMDTDKWGKLWNTTFSRTLPRNGNSYNYLGLLLMKHCVSSSRTRSHVLSCHELSAADGSLSARQSPTNHSILSHKRFLYIRPHPHWSLLSYAATHTLLPATCLHHPQPPPFSTES